MERAYDLCKRCATAAGAALAPGTQAGALQAPSITPAAARQRAPPGQGHHRFGATGCQRGHQSTAGHPRRRRESVGKRRSAADPRPVLCSGWCDVAAADRNPAARTSWDGVRPRRHRCVLGARYSSATLMPSTTCAEAGTTGSRVDCTVQPCPGCGPKAASRRAGPLRAASYGWIQAQLNARARHAARTHHGPLPALPCPALVRLASGAGRLHLRHRVAVDPAGMLKVPEHGVQDHHRLAMGRGRQRTFERPPFRRPAWM